MGATAIFEPLTNEFTTTGSFDLNDDMNEAIGIFASAAAKNRAYMIWKYKQTLFEWLTYKVSAMSLNPYFDRMGYNEQPTFIPAGDFTNGCYQPDNIITFGALDYTDVWDNVKVSYDTSLRLAPFNTAII